MATDSIRVYKDSSSTRVDIVLFRVRWILWLLVIPVGWVDNNGAPFSPLFWIWFVSIAAMNLTIGTIIRLSPMLPVRLPLLSFWLDILFFGVLPQIALPGANLLAFYAIYPALVGAVRFSPQVGLIVAGLLALPLEIRAFMPLVGQTRDWASLSAGLPVAALLAATALAGYLSQNEKEAAIRQAVGELDELRRAMAGAELLYRTTDKVSTTTSYRPVLEAMLEAGVKGLPQGRREDSPPVAMALFFDDMQGEKRLKVMASRHLDRRSEEQRIDGKEGIIAEALTSGETVVFENVAADPELGTFVELRRCKSGMCIPLQAGLEQYGVVVLASPAPRRPAQQHMELMRAFTNQAAIAFQNARLYQSLRVEHEQIIRSENEMRQKLARDLHDGPTQKVAGLAMQLDYIRRLMDKNPAEAKVELEKARETAIQTAKEIRTTLFSLRPLTLESKGLSAALEQYCERLRKEEGVPIQVDPGSFGIELNPDIAATVFAIIDEAVNNGRKHAPGAPIRVSVDRQEAHLVAVVQDQGPGFDVYKVTSSYDERSSFGLQNMRERAKLIEGDLRIDSEPGRGTRVTLVVPLPATQSHGTQL